MDKDVSSTFCPLPWVHLATYTDGSILPCCVADNCSKLNLNSTTLTAAWNSKFFRELRQDMMNGKKAKACNRCYIEEEGGYKSHRIMEKDGWIRRFGPDWAADAVKNTASDGHYVGEMLSLDLRLGNACNLSCVMCRPQDSTRWVRLARELQTVVMDKELRNEMTWKSGLDTKGFSWFDREDFWLDFHRALPNIRELIIGGGEPLLLEEQRELVKVCVEMGEANHIMLRYHTNGTVLPDEMFEQWKHFECVEFFVSLDDIGDRNSYVRHPAVWSDIEKNLKKLDSSPSNVKIMLLCSVHMLNMYYLDEYSRWIEQQQFKKITQGYNGYFHPGIVYTPDYLNIQLYPDAIKKDISRRILNFEKKSKKQSNKIQGVLNYMSSGSGNSNLDRTRDYLRSLDKVRGTNFSKSHPELNEHLGVY